MLVRSLVDRGLPVFLNVFLLCLAPFRRFVHRLTVVLCRQRRLLLKALLLAVLGSLVFFALPCDALHPVGLLKPLFLYLRLEGVDPWFLVRRLFVAVVLANPSEIRNHTERHARLIGYICVHTIVGGGLSTRPIRMAGRILSLGVLRLLLL